MTAAPNVSVVICAYTENRWSDLLAAIASCASQTHQPHETIVVSDHNPALLARLHAQAPSVRAIANAERQGLSGARNSGVAVAVGEIVAFLDDDAVAAADWLRWLTAPYLDEAVIGVGGAIDPVWPRKRPVGLPPEFDWVVGCSYRGLPETQSPVRNMIGANMSLRRAVFEEVGGFRSGMGRIGATPLGCEETELCIRARRRYPMASIIYEPRARVLHRVSPGRTGWRYFRARCYAEGLSKAAVAGHAGRRDGLASERSYTLRTLPRGVLRGVAETLTLRDLAGAVRGVGILTGLLVTTSGYVVGSFGRRKGHGGF